jgi:hypothetical protein
MVRPTPVDTLVAESERLRHDLLRAAAKLKGFAEDLIEESRDDEGAEDGDGEVSDEWGSRPPG